MIHRRLVIIAIITLFQATDLLARMSNTGAGFLGAGAGFLAGSMIASSQNRGRDVYVQQPPVYTTVDRRQYHYYNDAESDSDFTDDLDDQDEFDESEF